MWSQPRGSTPKAPDFIISVASARRKRACFRMRSGRQDSVRGFQIGVSQPRRLLDRFPHALGAHAPFPENETRQVSPAIPPGPRAPGRTCGSQLDALWMRMPGGRAGGRPPSLPAVPGGPLVLGRVRECAAVLPSLLRAPDTACCGRCPGVREAGCLREIVPECRRRWRRLC